MPIAGHDIQEQAQLSDTTVAAVGSVLFATFILYAPPSIAVMTVLFCSFCLLIACLSFAKNSVAVPIDAAKLSILLLLAFFAAVAWPLLGGASIVESASGIKFLGFFAAFLIGVVFTRPSAQIEFLALWLICVTFLYHVAVRKLGLPSPPFYPTDPNTTMILNVVLFPVAFRNVAWIVRPVIACFWIYYADILDSRSMMLLAPVLLVPHSFTFRVRWLVPIVTIVLVVVVHDFQINWETNQVKVLGAEYTMRFSDRVRIDIWLANFSIWGQNALLYFPKGETWLLNEINSLMSIETQLRFSAQNSHNVWIEIIGLFGMSTAILFAGFFVFLWTTSFSNPVVRLIIVLLFLVTLIEPGLNDSRVFLLTFLFFGMLVREEYSGKPA